MPLQTIVDPLADWDNLPLSHDRIGYQNLLTTSSAGGDSGNALTPNTFLRWTDPAGTMTTTFRPPAGAMMDYVAIGGHNLGTVFGVTVTVSVNSTFAGPFTAIGSARPEDDTALFFMFERQTVREVKVEIEGGTDREVALVYAGIALQMFQPIYGGHSPLELSSATDYQDSKSESGQFLGRTIKRRGTRTTFSYSHLDPQWYREYFQPFVEAAKNKPFFIRFRPDLYETAGLVHTTGNIRPSNMGGGHDLMQVSFDVMGHADK